MTTNFNVNIAPTANLALPRTKFQDMEIRHLHHSHLLLPPYSPQFKFTSNFPSFFKPLNQKWCLTHKPPVLCCIAFPNSTNYGGWEDLGLIQDPYNSSKLNQFQDFLVSIGIDDRKHVFMFVLGFVSALAISRIRVSSILVFPASVLVFSVGFTLGFVRRGGFLKEISFIDGNKENDISKARVDEKLSKLVEVIAEVGLKVMDLEKEMSGVLMLDRMQNGDLGNCYNLVKSVNSDIAEAKNIVEDTMKDMSGESVNDGEGVKSVNQKLSKKKKDPGSSYFDFFQAVRGLFHESASVTKSSKMKDNPKRESVEQLNSNVMNGQNLKSFLSERTDDVQASSSEFDCETENNQIDLSLTEALENRVWSQRVVDNSVDGAGKENVVEELVNANPTTIVEDFSHFDYSTRIVNNNGNFMDIGHPNREDMFMPRDKLYDPLDLNFNTTSSGVDVRSFTVDSKTSLQPEEYHVASNRYQGKFHRKRNFENGSSNLDIDQWKEESNDIPNSAKQQFAHDQEVDSGSSSSVISEDLMFSKQLTEATDLLKNARECLKIRADEDRAEIMLYKAARLLSRAAAMKPMSLLAVGQLGNTFLLHGELKLRISRELRTVLSRNEYSSRGKFRIAIKGLGDRKISRDRVASILIDVCEECEGLLVEAGRQYKMALSIDGNDVRALYNWGLALSYRAQLIADIGPEAASDADRVYLAAIDKFDAMMSKNKVYAPDALFRWGMALQQRSRLRPNNAKEKKKLLHQAKSLFEDALCMDSNKVQVREALSSCISELNYSHF